MEAREEAAALAQAAAKALAEVGKVVAVAFGGTQLDAMEGAVPAVVVVMALAGAAREAAVTAAVAEVVAETGLARPAAVTTGWEALGAAEAVVWVARAVGQGT
jgi:hypothetical protein